MEPSGPMATISSVPLLMIDLANDSTPALAAATMSGLSATSFSTRRFHWLSAYFSNSEALKSRNSVAIRVTARVATVWLVMPASMIATTSIGRMTKTIFQRMLTPQLYTKVGTLQDGTPRKLTKMPI